MFRTSSRNALRISSCIPSRTRYIPFLARPYQRSISTVTSAQPPTLDSIPVMRNIGVQEYPFKSLISAMQVNRYYTWGFVIYRCSYTDDALWEQYMDRLKQDMRNALRKEGQLDLLWQYLKLIVIEDPELEGATKHEVRTQFRKWVNNSSVERDGHGADVAKKFNDTRFSYCLFVDKRCLDTMAAYDAWVAAGSNSRTCAEPGMSRFVVCAIVDLHCKAAGQGCEGFPPIEGCVREYTGWMYISTHVLISMYDILCQEGREEPFDYGNYDRPPLVWPSGIRPASSIQA